MTIREYLRRQKRRSSTVVGLGAVIFIGGAIAGASGSRLVALAIVAFIVCALGGIFLGFCVRCPQCRGRIGQILGQVGSPFTIPASLRFCPFCGIGLDSPYPGERAS